MDKSSTASGIALYNDSVVSLHHPTKTIPKNVKKTTNSKRVAMSCPSSSTIYVRGLADHSGDVKTHLSIFVRVCM